jgi:hypothetical protein
MSRPILKNYLPLRQHLILSVIMNIILLTVCHYLSKKKLNDKEKIQILQNVWVSDNNFNFFNQQNWQLIQKI